MDGSIGTATRNDVVRVGLVPERPLGAPALVYDRFRRRFDSIFGIAPESDRRTDDLLASATPAGVRRYHIFCHLFLSRKCRRVLEPGLAIERRSCYPGIHVPIASGHARAMDKHFYFN